MRGPEKLETACQVAGRAPCDGGPSAATQGPRTRVPGVHLKHHRSCRSWRMHFGGLSNEWLGRDGNLKEEVGEAPLCVSKQRALQRVPSPTPKSPRRWSGRPALAFPCRACQGGFWRSSTDLGRNPATACPFRTALLAIRRW